MTKLDFSKVGNGKAPGGAHNETGRYQDQHFNQQTQITVKPKGNDLSAAKDEIRVYEDRILSMVAESKALEITDDMSNSDATEKVAQVKRLITLLEDERKRIIKEPNEFVRNVNAFVKRYRDQLQSCEQIIKQKIGKYSYEVELRRREEEKRMQRAAEEEQKRIDEKAKAAGVDTVELPKPVLPVRQEPVRTESGTASTVTVWRHEVIDAGLVPRSYLMVDDKKIKEAIRAGIREIPGVRIYEEMDVRVRRTA